MHRAGVTQVGYSHFNRRDGFVNRQGVCFLSVAILRILCYHSYHFIGSSKPGEQAVTEMITFYEDI